MCEGVPMHKPQSHKPKICKPKIHFEQVSLEVVKKIVKEQVDQRIPNADEIDKETLKNGIGGVDQPSPAVVSFGPFKL
jgi:hypothetical protein